MPSLNKTLSTFGFLGRIALGILLCIFSGFITLVNYGMSLHHCMHEGLSAEQCRWNSITSSTPYAALFLVGIILIVHVAKRYYGQKTR